MREVRNLRRADDHQPGITRIRAGRGFTYQRPSGSRVADAATLARIRSLAVPPAWVDVWICPQDDGHVQATGRDARGRKQYRYHDQWRAAREQAKFEMVASFGRALPAIRRRRDRDLLDITVDRDTVTAGIVLLLERTMIRVGNEEYVRQNGHFGLTTLRSNHVRIARDGTVRLSFVGKSGAPHLVEIDEPQVTDLVRACRKLRGDEHLFCYRNGDGLVHPVNSQLVNDYLRQAAQTDITAKDFRTWMATLFAANTLAGLEPPASASQATRTANQVIDQVAGRLRNTRAVCRSSYIHPAVLATYLDGSLPERWSTASPDRARGLRPEERRLLGFLRTLEGGATRLARAA
jgi:DNA topoisomerase-1